jgi:hypothetical protein
MADDGSFEGSCNGEVVPYVDQGDQPSRKGYHRGISEERSPTIPSSRQLKGLARRTLFNVLKAYSLWVFQLRSMLRPSFDGLKRYDPQVGILSRASVRRGHTSLERKQMIVGGVGVISAEVDAR